MFTNFYEYNAVSSLRPQGGDMRIPYDVYEPIPPPFGSRSAETATTSAKSASWSPHRPSPIRCYRNRPAAGSKRRRPFHRRFRMEQTRPTQAIRQGRAASCSRCHDRHSRTGQQRPNNTKRRRLPRSIPVAQHRHSVKSARFSRSAPHGFARAPATAAARIVPHRVFILCSRIQSCV